MPPSPPPVPTFASILENAKILTVTWDQAILAGPLAPANWTGTKGGGVGDRFLADLHVSTIGNQTVFHVDYFGVGVFPTTVSYAALPADVKGVTGQPTLEFKDFPLTVLP